MTIHFSCEGPVIENKSAINKVEKSLFCYHKYHCRIPASTWVLKYELLRILLSHDHNLRMRAVAEHFSFMPEPQPFQVMERILVNIFFNSGNQILKAASEPQALEIWVVFTGKCSICEGHYWINSSTGRVLPINVICDLLYRVNVQPHFMIHCVSNTH